MAEDELKALHRKRGSVKTKLTHFQKFLNKLSDKKAAGSQFTENDIIQLEDRIEKYSILLTEEFEPLQLQIEELVEQETDLENEFFERETFECNFHDVMASAKILLREIRPTDQTSSIVDEREGSEHSYRGNDLCFEGVKLPDIKLPTFNGSYESWLDFRDLYVSLIDQNPKLKNIQKFHYLRASLEGPASQVIKSLEFVGANYETAWNLVKKRFENKKLLVHNHLEALCSLGKLDKNTVNSSNLRKLSDNVSKHLRALESLGMVILNWDILVIHLVVKCLDDGSVAKWEEFRYQGEMPTLDDMYAFLKNRADLLERLEMNKLEKGFSSGQKYKGKVLFTPSDVPENKDTDAPIMKKCEICSGDHLVHLCNKFKSLSVSERNDQVKRLKLCAKCLRSGHFLKFCKLYGSCKISGCNSRKHNTLLHTDSDSSKPTVHDNKVTENSSNKGTGKTQDVKGTISCHSSPVTSNCDSLLSTAVVEILDSDGTPFPVRAVLDSGSSCTYVTESLCDKLGITKKSIDFVVFGINGIQSKVNYRCEIKLVSRYNNFKTNIPCLVTQKITENLPCVPVDLNKLSIPQDCKLADEYFYRPGPVDILIGADLFWNLLCNKQISLGLNNPVLQETQLGWIVAGKISGNRQFNKSFCNLTQTNQNFDVQIQLEKFFEIENVPEKGRWSNEEIECEKHFIENTKRLPSGRFQVSIPFKKSVENLGESFEQAKTRFLSLERKLSRDPNYKKLYSEYIDSYKVLGQMRKVSLESEPAKICYYLPHHGVLREQSTSTKLRVVFDASAKTSTGMSLNDLQMKGPVIQDDLFAILLRFRQYPLVVSADIEKMYRQVNVKDEQCNLQRILWRDSPEDDLSIYEMTTVTFGMTSSPFLAIRCLAELAQECRQEKPHIAEIIEHDFYVDDMLSGFDDLETARQNCIDLANVLGAGSFPLRKWRSNTPELLDSLKLSVCVDQSEKLSFGDSDVTKTLGLEWSSQLDKLSYTINVSKIDKVTKRTMLSCIAKLFDPLGLLSPCIILAKVMLQQLWKLDLSWDSEIPSHLQNNWKQFILELECLNNLKIERNVICLNPVRVELHAFSDASDVAYGACVYICSQNDKGEKFCNLLCSKTKVCPIKPLTTPRAELCAAHVLTKLVDKVVSSLRLNFDRSYYYSDSKIILGWINTSANLLKPFVRNRVAEIQELTEASSWRYVPSQENPADLLSRGLNPKNIFESDLWWHGPAWLLKNEEQWPCNVENLSKLDLPELKSTSLFLQFDIENYKNMEFNFENFSKLNRLKRTMSFILRFKNNCLSKPELKSKGPLAPCELDDALKVLVRVAQFNSFPEEYKCLLNSQNIDRKSKLLSLNPFLDEFGIMRLGGRIRHSNFQYNKKHPMILCAKNHLTKLIFEEEHLNLMHAGPQQTLYGVRENYWVIGGKNLSKAVVHSCVRCHRFKTKIVQPMMGNLPKERFNVGFPFQVSGIDYAGPFWTLNKRGRGSSKVKTYVCLFICFSTKAIHLEMVCDLSTESFLLALKRFISRRGKPTDLFSDNGSNFLGANRELKEVKEFFDKNQSKIIDFVNNQGITWHFNPAYAPHFGGLWEAGVKKMKHHMKRVLFTSRCTGVEFGTLLCQIEAILNSRPLSPLSNDPLDPLPLTPSHYLIGRPISATLEHDLSHLNENRLSRYQKLESYRQNLWKRWQKEYVSELQLRTKWKENHGALRVGTLVIIKDDNLPPLNWKLGRVTKIFPGQDNIVRVCEIKTSNGLIKRDFTKICPLPESN